MYEHNAHFYDFFAPKSQDAEIKISFLKNLVTPASHLLDLGAGTGKVALGLAHNGYKVSCIETSPSMRSVFLTKLTALNLDSQITLFPQEISEVNPSRPVDCGFAFDLFLLITNTEQRQHLLKNLARLIRKDGLFVANFIPAHPKRPTKELAESSRRTIGDLTYKHLTAVEQVAPTQRKVSWVFETHCNDKLIAQTREEFLIQQDNLEELKYLFESCGLTIEKALVGFTEKAYTGEESELVLIARRIT